MNKNMMFTIEVQEIRRSNRIYKFPVKHFTSIKEIKGMLQKIFPFDLTSLHLFHPSRSLALANHTTLHELGIDRDGFLLMLSITVSGSSTAPQSVPVLEPMIKAQLLDGACKEMIKTVRQGLLSGNNAPGKTDLLDCTGGVYFMKEGGSHGHIAAVFKPHDEEQGMLNNPKGYAGNGKVGLRKYFNPGEGYLREAAAYLLDVKNITKVPPTCIVHCEHPTFNYPHFSTVPTSFRSIYPKLGSLQQYVKAADTFEDISSSLISVYEIQKIALFDMRLLNCDRNSANILCVRKPIVNNTSPRVITNAAGTARRDSRSGSMTSNGEDVDYDAEIDMNEFMNRASITTSSASSSSSNSSSRRGGSDQYELIPIDHGYCLPTHLCIEDFDWVWFTCPHIEQPIDPRLKQYMKEEVNLEESIDHLRRQGIALPEDSLFLYRLTHQLILQGMDEGLTLKEIACLICRTEDGVPSPLEKAIASAEENAERAFAVHGSTGAAALLAGNSNLKTSFSPPRKMVNRSPMTTAANLLGLQRTTPTSSSVVVPVVAEKDSSHDNVNSIVNNVLLLPKATTASSTQYPMMMNMPKPLSAEKDLHLNHEGVTALPRSYASSPLVAPHNSKFVQGIATDPLDRVKSTAKAQGPSQQQQQQQGEEEHGEGDFDDFLLHDSYLRPKGPITFMSTLDSALLPKTGTTTTSTSSNNGVRAPLPVSPKKELPFQQHGSYLQQFNNGLGGGEGDYFQSDLSMVNSLSMVREESVSTSHDEQDNYESSNCSSEEGRGSNNMTFFPVRSPPRSNLYSGTTQSFFTVTSSTTAPPATVVKNAVPPSVSISGPVGAAGSSTSAEEFFLSEEGDEEVMNVPISASSDTAFRRVSSFSNLEVQTTEPMIFFEKPSRLALSRETSSSNPQQQQQQRQLHSGFTSEEEMEDTSGHSPYSELIMMTGNTGSNIPPETTTTFSWAQKLGLGGGVPGNGLSNAPGLTRVVSFNAFESPALYEVDRTDRHFNRLKREKRKLSVKSPEFQELRLQFAEQAIVKTIARLHPKTTPTLGLTASK